MRLGISHDSLYPALTEGNIGYQTRLPSRDAYYRSEGLLRCYDFYDSSINILQERNRENFCRKKVKSETIFMNPRSHRMFYKYLFIFLLGFSLTISNNCYSQNDIPSSSQGKPVILERSDAALGISAKTRGKIKAIKNPPLNIALFAVDRRTPKDAGNSDVIMVISINQINGEVKMASILRDTYVKIEGHGMDKINAAYAIGGPQLAIKTINENFDLDIKDYINVDFYTAARIVDAVGGVEVNVKPAEVRYLNNYLDEIAIYEKIPASPIKEAGLQNLTGRQAVAYTRIRGVGNNDYERTERQRNVLITLFKKMKSSGQELIPVFSKTILPNLETSMSKMSALNFAGSIFYSQSKTVKQARFPLNNQTQSKRINNILYLVTDLKAMTNSMYSFIYK